MKKKITLLTCLFSVISFACPYCDAMNAATQKEDEKPDKIALNFDKEILKHTNIYSDLSLNFSYENKKNNRLIKPTYSIEPRLNIGIKYIQ